MTTITIREEWEKEAAIKLIQNRKPPFHLKIIKGIPRSVKQNRVQRMWCNELAEQGDMTAEEYRGHMKLHFGVPILRNECAAFCEGYDRVIKPFPYETKLAMMMDPFDFGVSRLMTTKQFTKYLDDIYVFFTTKGFRLTEPER